MKALRGIISISVEQQKRNREHTRKIERLFVFKANSEQLSALGRTPRRSLKANSEQLSALGRTPRRSLISLPLIFVFVLVARH